MSTQAISKVNVSAPRAERYSAGKTLRDVVSRESHADCPPGSERDPIAILGESDALRLPNLAADPLPAHVSISLHLSSWRGGGDGA